MTLNELSKLQEEFDSRHEGTFQWNMKVTNANIDMLEFLVLALAGEIGETANIVKRIVRGDFSLEEKMECYDYLIRKNCVRGKENIIVCKVD